MKKLLLSCVAVSGLFLSHAAFAAPAEPVPVQAAVQPAGDTFSQAKLSEAFQDFLGINNFGQNVALVIEELNDGYIVTVPEISVPVIDGQKIISAQKIQLTRAGDFAGMPQYRVKMDFLNRMKSAFDVFAPGVSIDADQFEETLLWVPQLQLIANESLKASNITVDMPNVLSMNVKSAISDLLANPKLGTDKMDVASVIDAYDILISSPHFKAFLPQITVHDTIINSEILGDEVMQMLTAERSSSMTEIPSIQVTSFIMPEQKLTAKAAANFILSNAQLNLDMKISDIEVAQLAHPLVPKNINMQLVFDNVDNASIIRLYSLQKQLQELPQTPENNAVANQISGEISKNVNDLMQKIIIRFPEFSISNDNAGIAATGVITGITTDPALDMTLTVTNFDLISPKPRPIDEKKCQEIALKINQNPSDFKLIEELQSTCVPQPMVLESLRPYLSTAIHSVNDKGQTVDTFAISMEKGKVTVNGQLITPPAAFTTVMSTPDAGQTQASEIAPVKEIVHIEIDEEAPGEVETMQGNDNEKLMDDFVEPNKIVSATKQLQNN
ncbi:MAG: hypothetical protein LBU87_00310 [Lactobacillales bacterium]|jgi:hypothetical protein|nr:hypothetical protein [Lactobacillales bacterium]